MSDLDGLPWDYGDSPATPSTATPRRHRHNWQLRVEDGQPFTACANCGTLADPVRQRRGRRALRVGKDAERVIAKAYGGRRTGQYGGPDDVVVEGLFVVQSKVRGAFPSWMWDELMKLPRSGGRIPTLIVSDRPAPGVHARRLVVRLMADDVDLHGGDYR